MVYVKLKTLRTLNEEIQRLEKMRIQIARSRSEEKKKRFGDNLKQCKAEKHQLISECLVESLRLTDEEKEMAKNFYYKGMTWEESFENSPLYKESFDDEDDEEVKKAVNRYKKYIEREVQKI